jgi:hypothetical protein
MVDTTTVVFSVPTMQQTLVDQDVQRLCRGPSATGLRLANQKESAPAVASAVATFHPSHGIGSHLLEK